VTAGSLQREAYGFYFALTRSASVAADSREEPGLGGKLLYAGKLDAESRALVVAANVAGCATLAATDETSAQKQSIRDGVFDFLVTSLDEALRILKNEIRTHKTVAVCVGRSHELVEQEMLDRGVQPDFVFVGFSGQERTVEHFGKASQEIQFIRPEPGLALLSWQVAEAPARWMPKLDAFAVECLEADPWARRWIRLSPRYCGRSALAPRVLYCDPRAAKEIIQRIADSVRKNEIGAEVSATLEAGGECTLFRMQRSENEEKSL
jgi:urocanate hydratase